MWYMGFAIQGKQILIFKRSTAKAFYKLMIKMGVDIVDDHADFRLMSNRALKKFK